MKIVFGLPWVKAQKKIESQFKSSPCALLVQEYTKRINKFIPCEISGVLIDDFAKANRGPQQKIWLCDRGTHSKIFSSEDIAKKLTAITSTSTQVLTIALGDSEGWDEKQIESQNIQIDLRWSFGPLTLPHELAAVVATEQIYRALEIIHGGPYHK
jgi:23S rRNA (pseudouridine1915-N3)-methyltransferase